MNPRVFPIVVLCVVLSAVFSCSGGSNPVSNPEGPAPQTQAVAASEAQTHLWGYYDIYLDPQTGAPEVVPDRDSMFTANVVIFLNASAGNLKVKVNSVTHNPGQTDIDLDLTITHPFPGKNQYEGNDVRGVFIGNGTNALKYNPKLLYSKSGVDQTLTNADGYTRWYNPVEFKKAGIFGYTPGKVATIGYNATGTLNPYKYFADGLGRTQDLWGFLNTNPGTHRGKFTAGQSNTRNYLASFPTTVGARFSYAILANWASPTIHPSNCDESVGLSVNVKPDIYITNSQDKGGNLILDVDCFGWTHQPSTIYIESTVLSAPVAVDPATVVTGSTQFESTYHINIPADNILTDKYNEFWVICQYDGYGYSNPANVPNTAVPDKLAACFRFNLPVALYPIGDIFVSNHADFAGLSENGTKTNPYHTIQAACDVVGDGDTILVDYGTGTYPETVFCYAKPPFILRAYNWHSASGRPLLGGPTSPGDKPGAGGVLSFTGGQYITVRGFKIAFAAGNSFPGFNLVSLLNASNLTFKDCFFTGDGSAKVSETVYAIFESYGENNTFTNCLFKDINSGANFGYVAYGIMGVWTAYASAVNVNKCEFTSLQSKPITTTSVSPISVSPIYLEKDYGNFNIHNNLFHHIAPSFTGTGAHAITNFNAMFFDTFTGPDTKGLVYNNTIDTLSAASDPTYTGTNLIAICSTNPDAGLQYADIHSNIVSDFLGTIGQELFGIRDINKTDYSDVWHTLRGGGEYHWFDAADEGVGCIFSNPTYVNNASAPYDYHLAAGSPCSGTGKGGTDMGCYGGLAPGEVIGLLGPE